MRTSQPRSGLDDKGCRANASAVDGDPILLAVLLAHDRRDPSAPMLSRTDRPPPSAAPGSFVGLAQSSTSAQDAFIAVSAFSVAACNCSSQSPS